MGSKNKKATTQRYMNHGLPPIMSMQKTKKINPPRWTSIKFWTNLNAKSNCNQSWRSLRIKKNLDNKNKSNKRHQKLHLLYPTSYQLRSLYLPIPAHTKSNKYTIKTHKTQSMAKEKTTKFTIVELPTKPLNTISTIWKRVKTIKLHKLPKGTMNSIKNTKTSLKSTTRPSKSNTTLRNTQTNILPNSSKMLKKILSKLKNPQPITPKAPLSLNLKALHLLSLNKIPFLSTSQPLVLKKARISTAKSASTISGSVKL